MKTRALCLVFGLVCIGMVSAKGPAVAPPPIQEGRAGQGALQAVLDDLTESRRDYQRLLSSEEVRFVDATARTRYVRALRRLDDACADLQDIIATGNTDLENWRGPAVVYLQDALMGSAEQEAIAALPSFVTRDDYDFVKYAADEMFSSKVAAALRAYFKNPSQPSLRNRKGKAAILVAGAVMSSYVIASLEALPRFVGDFDLPYLQQIVDGNPSSQVPALLKAYFGTRR